MKNRKPSTAYIEMPPKRGYGAKVGSKQEEVASGQSDMGRAGVWRRTVNGRGHLAGGSTTPQVHCTHPWKASPRQSRAHAACRAME